MKEPLTREQVEEICDTITKVSIDWPVRVAFLRSIQDTDASLRQQLEGVQKVRDEYHQQWMDASDAEDALKQQLAVMKKALVTLSKLGGGTSTGNDIARYALEEAKRKP